ncbi:MAG TPA: GNAT family N-acetyltransferase [Phenylobacterium sp.]
MSHVRPARPEDLPVLPQIELSAANLFEGSDKPMDVLTNVSPAETWARMQAFGTVWVVDDGEPVAFLAAEVLGQDLHIWELDVRHDRQRQGHGRRLMDHALAWGRSRGLSQATLTTYRDIPWNAPFYASLGFVEMSGPDLSVRLAQVLDLERSKGLDPAHRCAMALPLSPAP